MEIPYNPDANILLRSGAAEAEWYLAGLARYQLSRQPIEAPRLVARRVRRLSESVSVFRALFLQPETAHSFTR
jgi:hypothetical protein